MRESALVYIRRPPSVETGATPEGHGSSPVLQPAETKSPLVELWYSNLRLSRCQLSSRAVNVVTQWMDSDASLDTTLDPHDAARTQ